MFRISPYENFEDLLIDIQMTVCCRREIVAIGGMHLSSLRQRLQLLLRGIATFGQMVGSLVLFFKDLGENRFRFGQGVFTLIPEFRFGRFPERFPVHAKIRVQLVQFIEMPEDSLFASQSFQKCVIVFRIDEVELLARQFQQREAMLPASVEDFEEVGSA